MLAYELKRHWFEKHEAKEAQRWFDTQKVSRLSYCALTEKTNKPNGYLVTIGAEQGVSAASVLYQQHGSPANMIYVNYKDETNLWFVFAKGGILSNDYIVPLASLSGGDDDALNMIMAEIAFFDELSEYDSVTIICNETREVEDYEVMSLLNLFEINTPFQFHVAANDFNHTDYDESVFDQWVLVYGENLRFPSQVGKVVVVACAVALVIGLVVMMSVSEKKNQEAIEMARRLALANMPAIIVDKFSNLKQLLNTDGVGIKQRLAFVIEELFLINEISGYELKSYRADIENSVITLTRTYGKLANVKEIFPEHIFAYQPFTGGVKLHRQTAKFPIMNTAVRANIQAEIIWIEEAIEYVWADLVGVSTVKIEDVDEGLYYEVPQTVSFDKFSLEDIDSLASLYVGRSAGFVELSLVKEALTGFYKGRLMTVVIGVLDE